VHLLTRGHFLSRDKDSGHPIRSVIVLNPCCMLLHGSITEPLSYCRNRDFRPFLLMWPWPWFDLYIRI